MSTKRKIKQRQAAVGRIRKITYAMQVIAQTRLTRMKDMAISARSYHEKIRQILSSIVARQSEAHHPLLEIRDATKTLAAVIINSDRGLCGGFNNNILIKLKSLLRENPQKQIKFISLGKKGRRVLRQVGRGETIKSFLKVEKANLAQLSKELSKEIINLYLEKQTDAVYLIYNQYRLHLLGKATSLKILPIEPELAVAKEQHLSDYLYEPSTNDVLSAILPEYVYEQIYQAVLESRASEEMARMVAMKTATDNADEMIEKLQLAYHKARQALITKELTEIANVV